MNIVGYIKKCIEILISYVFAFVAIYIFYKLKIEDITISKFDTFFTIVATVAVTVIGFIITSITILLGLLRSKIISYIQDKEMWGTFLYYYIEPFVSGIILIGYSLYIVYFTGTTNIINKNNSLLFVFLLVFFTIGLLRLVYILINLLQCIIIENKPKNYNPRNVTESNPDDAF
ncbi:hypothetical protein [Wukongibacter sp. M2B1]|uniref:hypothetical protein n=1 Tax=Wukongibacter sp. M2B1 TaxID=3088895 RepID=UPI003D7A25B5